MPYEQLRDLPEPVKRLLPSRAQRIYRGGAAAAQRELLVEASVRVACLDARTLRPRRLPAFLLAALAAETSVHE